jgi:thymidylate kinase
MNAQIVLVDGIPGSGKSVVAQTIKRRMREAGQHVRGWYEEELDHAIYLFRDAATLQRVTDDLFSGAHERVIAAALDKWRSFAEEALHTGTSVVADGAFFGYLTWTLHYLDRPEAETRAYILAVQDAMAAFMPRLIYLRQRDVAATMRNLVAVRGQGWAERTIRKAVESP